MSSIYKINPLDLISHIALSSIVGVILLWWIYRLYCVSFKKTKITITSLPSGTTQTTASKPGDIEMSSSNKSYSPSPSDIEIEIYNKTQKKKQLKTLSKELPFWTKFLSIGHMLLVTISLSIVTIIIVVIKSTKNKCISFGIAYIFAIAARLFLYIYYMYRTKTIFVDSDLEIGSKRYKMIITWFVIGHISAALYYNAIHIPFVCYTNVDDDFGIILLLSLAWPAVNDSMISMFCLIYFLRKLKMLLKQTKMANAINMESMKQMHGLMKKLTVLSVVTICTTFMIGILAMFFVSSLAIDNIINIICLILSFGFMDNVYQKLCFPTDKFVSCCINWKHATNSGKKVVAANKTAD